MTYSRLFNPRHSPLWVDQTSRDSHGSCVDRKELHIYSSLGHTYDDALRCHFCFAEWKRIPEPCQRAPIPAETLNGRKLAGFIRREKRKADYTRRYAKMTEQERERIEAERRAKKAAYIREYRAARKAAQGGA